MEGSWNNSEYSVTAVNNVERVMYEMGKSSAGKTWYCGSRVSTKGDGNNAEAIPVHIH